MRAHINGVSFLVEDGGGWVELAGTAPAQASFALPVDVANRLFHESIIDGTSITIESEELGESVTFNGLTIIGTSPTDSPYLRTVDIVDQRFFWSRRHFFRRYNMRRRTGVTRRADENAPRAVQQIVDDVAFARYSLNPATGRPWTGEEILRDFFDWLVGPGRYEIDVGSEPLPEIEELEIDDPADVALGKILAALGGGLAVRIDRTGDPVIYPRLDGSEAELFGQPNERKITTVARGLKGFPQIVGEPSYDKQERYRERPRKVRVLFERLPEIRFDIVEKERNASVDPNAPPLVARNVVILPEDIAKDRVVGMPVPLDEYLAFLRGKQPQGLPALTRTIIRKGWISGALDWYVQADFTGQWAGRIAAIRESYRRLFLVEKYWVDRLRDMIPRRVSIEDYETGAQSASPAFFHHAVQLNWLGDGDAQRRPELAHTVRNVWAVKGTAANVATPPSVVGTPIKKLLQASAKVSVDGELGLIAWDLVADETAQTARYFRSALERDSIPTDNKLARNAYLQEGVLVDDFEASVIVTAILGAPNDRRRFFEVELGPTDVHLPLGASRRAEGPVLEIRVSAAKLPARYAWDDDRAAAFEEAFREEVDIKDPIGDAIGEPLNKAELEAYARAVAQRVYQSYVDRWVGGLTTGLNSSLSLRGAAKSVAHEANTDQGAVTRVDLPGDPAPLSIEAILPPEVRRSVDFLVDRKG